MNKKNAKTIYSCRECGYQTPKWMGKCPDCGRWDTLAEEIAVKSKRSYPFLEQNTEEIRPVPIDAIDIGDEERVMTGINEFDRVLGGGLVAGSLVLIGGDPGIGKSTLMLQALNGLTGENRIVLYVSGEESNRQIRIRSKRLGISSSGLHVLSEIDLDSILSSVSKLKPLALAIDSIQTMYNSEVTSAPGSVGQVRESAMRLMLSAKKSGIPTFLIGHVTKEGAIAGPKLLEHMVDTVLYFEGERNHVFRILRAVKNRFGSTNEIGVFEMKDTGLDEVPNPSAVFLSERPEEAPGSVVTACMEGTRPILVELQALASGAGFSNPRRTVLGLDHNRVALLVAVMEKKLGMHLAGHDIFMNVAGGVKVDEPAADLAIVAAIASSFLDKAIGKDNIMLGEIGLAGEVRAISHAELRVAEIRKLGFTQCIVPEGNLRHLKHIDDIRIQGVKTVSEAVDTMF